MVALPTATRDCVRALNDRLRQRHTGGSVVTTPGIRELGADALATVVRAVADFDAFTLANDPHGQHDFGSVAVAGQTVFFKIDAYDLALCQHSPDPANPAVTHRVMTLMLAEEY